MPYQVIIIGRRKPGTSFADFKKHYNEGHIPLLQSLLGPEDFPTKHERYFFARGEDDEPIAFVGPPAGQKAADSVSILTFEDEAHWHRCGAKMQNEENAKKVHEDEEKFADRASFTMVVVGDVSVTEK